MAGAAFHWKQGLSEAVASNISDLMAPLETLFTVERIGQGEDGMKVSTSSGGLTMANVAKGSTAANDSDYAFGGATITPVPMNVAVPIARHDLQYASPAQVDDLIVAFTEAGHQAIITKLGAAIEASQTDAAHVLTTYDVMTEAAWRAAKWKVKKNKAPGRVRALVSATDMESLENDLISKNLNAPITEQVAGGLEMVSYAGVLGWPDVYLGDDGGSPAKSHTLFCTQRAVRIVFGGVGPEMFVLPTNNGINVRLSMNLYVEVGIPNPLLACWVKTNA